MNYPEYAEANGKKYKINTDFRIAIECNEIAIDETIGDYERALAIIYKLYGDEGLNDIKNQVDLLRIGQKFLACGKQIESKQKKEEPDMDYVQDMDYIEASFMSDYGIDLSKEEMHWWKFMKLLNGLSNSEMGNCCILNRIRNIRNINLKDIKDPKEKKKIIDLKKQFAIKKKKNKKPLTEEEKNNVNEFMKLTGIERK